MSFEASQWVFEHSRATGNARLCAAALAHRCQTIPGHSWPSLKTIRRDMGGVGVNTALRALRTLEALGELEVYKGAGGDEKCRADRRPNLYVLIHVEGACPPVDLVARHLTNEVPTAEPRNGASGVPLSECREPTNGAVDNPSHGVLTAEPRDVYGVPLEPPRGSVAAEPKELQTTPIEGFTDDSTFGREAPDADRQAPASTPEPTATDRPPAEPSPSDGRSPATPTAGAPTVPTQPPEPAQAPGTPDERAATALRHVASLRIDDQIRAGRRPIPTPGERLGAINRMMPRLSLDLGTEARLAATGHPYADPHDLAAHIHQQYPPPATRRHQAA